MAFPGYEVRVGFKSTVFNRGMNLLMAPVYDRGAPGRVRRKTSPTAEKENGALG